MASQMTVKIVDASGATDSVTMNSLDMSHIVVEFTNNDETGPIYKQLIVSDDFGQVPDVAIDFIEECVPDHPFYIRWINYQGGYDYKMFSQNKEYSWNVSDIVTYQPFFDDTPTTKSTRRVIGMNAKDTISVGIDQINEVDFHIVKGILFSPKIEHWNEERQTWEEITLDGNSANLKWNTRAVRGTAEFTFNLRARQTQF